MSKKKYIYLPIEIKLREFIPKLYLISFLIELGYVCIIGDRKSIYHAMNFLPRGVLFVKDIAKEKAEEIKRLRSKSSHLICMDEEAGIARTDIASFFNVRISRETLDFTNRFYCYGENDYCYLFNNYKEYRDRFVLTGSPRIDIWKPEIGNKIFGKKINNLKKDYGEYILINSSIGIAAEEKVEFDVQQSLAFGYIQEKEVPAYRGLLKKRLQEFHEFAKLINQIAKKFPNRQFVLRPHPAEKTKHWLNVIDSRPNLSVIREGDVTPWILASQMVIHEGCTTAIQALIAHKPVITIRPLIVSSNSDVKSLNNFPNEISYSVRSFDELNQVIPHLLAGGNQDYFDEKRELIKERIYNLNGINAAMNITKDILSIEDRAYSNVRFELKFQHMLIRKMLSGVKWFILDLLRRNRKETFRLRVRDVVDNKIPGGINTDEIQDFFFSLNPLKKKRNQIKIRKLKENLVLIKKR